MFYSKNKVLISTSFVFAIILMIIAPFSVKKTEAGFSLKKAIPGDVGKAVVSAAGQCVVGIGASLAASKLKSYIDSLTGNVPTGGANDITTMMGTTLKTYCLDVIGIQLAKNVLQKFTQSTVTWIQTGFKGGPLYVKDPGAFFSSIADEELVDISLSYRGSLSPFGDDIARNIISSYKMTLDDSVRYNLDKIADKATIEKYNVDFSAGGWDAWLMQTQLPQNNPIGATFTASDHITKNVSVALKPKAAQVQEELNQGMGFLGIKKCTIPKGYQEPPKGWSREDTEAIINNPNSSVSEVTDALSDLNQYTCQKWETQTPGNVIASKLNLELGTSTRQAELADQLNESVAAIFDALAGQLINEGLGALDGGDVAVNTTGNGGYGSNTSFSDTITTTSGSGGQWYNASDTNVDLWHDIDPQIALENAYIAKITEQKNIIANQLLPKLYELDYCVPGPRPDWETDANEILSQSKTSMSETYSDEKAAMFIYDHLDITLPKWSAKQFDGYASRFDLILNNTMEKYRENIQNTWFSSVAMLYLPTINAINVQEHKAIKNYQDEIENIDEEIVTAKGNVNKLTYIKEQVSSIPDPSGGTQLTQEQKDITEQAKRVYSQIKSDLVVQSVLNDEDRNNADYLAKVQYIGNQNSGLIKECVQEVAQMQASGNGNKIMRFPYPSNLLSPSTQSLYQSLPLTYSPTGQVLFQSGIKVISKQEISGPSYALPTLYYGIDTDMQPSGCPVNSSNYIWISYYFNIGNCANTAAFERFINMY